MCLEAFGEWLKGDFPQSRVSFFPGSLACEVERLSNGSCMVLVDVQDGPLCVALVSMRCGLCCSYM